LDELVHLIHGISFHWVDCQDVLHFHICLKNATPFFTTITKKTDMKF